MQREGYRVTAEFEATHWWFLSRRELILLQVRKGAAELGFPERQLQLLDYGCGTGFNLRFLADFGAVCGADIVSEPLLEHWKESGYPLLDLAKDTSEHEAQFDIVTALDVLEHMTDDVEGLRKMQRFLRPNGQIILTVPAYRWLWSGEDVLSEHKRRYKMESLLACCRNAGCEVLYASYFNLSILPAMAAVIAVKKLLFSGREPQSNLAVVPGVVNTLLYRLTALEARFVGRELWPMPAGPSLICRLKSAKKG